MSQESARVIKDFLFYNRLSKRKFAICAGISRFSVYKYLAGSRIHPKTAKKMEDNILESLRLFLPYEKLTK